MEKTKVLFVDDDIALGQVVILALRASGYAAEYCTTLVGIQGVVQEMQPDIMVLDVEIGEKNGIDAVAELKLTAPDTPILFVSSHIAGSEVARALDAGGIAYLRKPFEMEELVAYRGVGGLYTQAHAMFSSERTIHRNVQSESRRQYVVQRRGTCEKAD